MKKIAGFLWMGCCLVSVALGGGAPLLLDWGTLDTGSAAQQQRSQALRTSSRATTVQSLSARGTAPWLVQFNDVIREEWKTEMEAAGAKLKGYIPENAFLVEASPKAIAKIGAMAAVNWVGEFLPDYKKSTPVRALLAKGIAESRAYTILLFQAGDVERIAQEIENLTGEAALATAELPDGGLVRANLAPAVLETVSGWGEVQWIEPYMKPQLWNDVAIRTNRMNVTNVWTTLGLTGAGQTIAVCDTGLDTGNIGTLHRDFTNRVVWTQALGRSGNWSDTDGHGTHVAGSVLGGGVLSTGKYKGVAYEASLVFQSVLNSSGGLSLPSDLNTLFRAAFTNGARIHSNSWGANDAGAYSTYSRDLDMFVWSNKTMLVLVAAGNAGIDANSDGVIDLDSIGSPATAKNCLTVGAAENYRTTGGYSTAGWGSLWPSDYPVAPIKADYTSRPDSPQGMAAFSSRGPCDDGRIKPDIVAPGTDIISTRSRASTNTGWGLVSGNTNYLYEGGTSMATPLTAGAAGLARQWVTTTGGIANPSAALLKALLINGARNMAPGQYGTGGTQEIPDVRPSNVQGWGHVDLYNTLQPATNQFLTLVDTNSLSTGQTNVFTLTVSTASTNKFILTMAYADYWATAGSAHQLVNDLDLKVQKPSGSNLFANGQTLADTNNNVEMIEFAADEVGTYTVRIVGRNVPQSPQAYALVMRGPQNDTTPTAPAFTSPNAYIASVGAALAFTVVASGYPVPALALQATTATSGYAFSNATGQLTYTPPAGDGGTTRTFTFTASNSVGVATQTVSVAVNVPAAIAGNPQPLTNNAGTSASFTVTATGTAPLHYQWQKNAADVSLATNATYTIGAITTNDAGSYRCRVSNLVNAVTSGVATLTVNSPPIFNSLGIQTAFVGTAKSFTVSATGNPTPTLALLSATATAGSFTFTNATGGLMYIPSQADVGTKTFTFTASNSVGVATQIVSVVVGEAPVGGGMENFNNFTPSGSTYASGTFTGQDGSTWTYAKARGDCPINGQTPTIRNQTAAYIESGTISGGVADLTFKYRKPFSDSAMGTLVYVIGQNSTYTGTVTTVPSTTNEILTFTATGVNVAGDFTLLFTNTASTARIGIDDISWTGYSSGAAAPTFGVNPGPVSATVGVEAVFTVSASGNPTPALALQGTTASGGSYVFSNATGQLSYTPWIADGGTTKTFTFTASNSLGVATQTVSVVVSVGLPAAPASIWASATNAADFTAEWSAVASATNYRLDVATNNSFSGGSGGAVSVLTENFAGFTTTSGTVDRSSALNAYMQTAGWTGAAVYENAGEAKLGSSTARGILTTPVLNLSSNGGQATLTFDSRSWAGDATVLQVYVATDGVNYVQSGANVALTETMATYTNFITNGTSACNVRIYALNAASERFYLDNWSITQSGGGAPSYVPGYSNLAVSGTSQSVVGLAPGATYYFRARAANAAGTSPDSATTNVTTVAGATAPAFTGGAGPYATTAGVAVAFTVSASGNPAPALALQGTTASVGSYVFSNATGQLNYTPPTNDVGMRTFTFTASNGMGVATQTVSVSVAPPPSYVPTVVVTNVGTNGFTVNWTEVTDATTYQVQIGTDTNFTAATAGANLLNETFATLTATTPPSGWTTSVSNNLTDTQNFGAASPAYRFGTTGQALTSPTFAAGATNLQFWGYGRSGTGTYVVSGLVSGVWTLVDTVTIAQNGATYNVPLNSQTTRIKFTFIKAGSVNCRLDDVVVQGAGTAGSLVVDDTVAALTYGATDLDLLTAYYVRVRAPTGTWSTVVQAITLGNNPVLPWFTGGAGPFGATVGVAVAFTESAMGVPTPVLALQNATAGGGSYAFTANTGTFLYTPPSGDAGTQSFAFTASNSVGVVTQVVTVTVAAATAPAFSALGTQYATTGVNKAFTVLATGAPTPMLALAGTTASSGYSFSSDAGRLSYTPPTNDVGTRTFTFTASNLAGVATQTVAVVVSNVPPAAPMIDSIPQQSTRVGLALNYTITATDPDSAVVTFSCTSAVASATWTFNTNSGAFAFTPTTNQIGTNVFTFQARDNTDLLSPASNLVVVVSAVGDPVAVSFGQTRIVGEEGGATVEIPVKLAYSGSATVQVRFSGPTNGTAQWGTDFTCATNLTISGAAGNLVVNIVNDNLAEGPESVTVTLVPVSPATAGATTQAVLYIRDDDTVSIAAANITSGSNQEYDAPGSRILQALCPDVVLIQEFNMTNGTSEAAYRAWVDQNFGTNFSYYHEPVASASIPNGIVSRWPILASGEWDDTTLTDRDFVWAKIQLPGTNVLNAVSVHIKASSGYESQRTTEARALTNYVTSAGMTTNGYVVIGGDFNLQVRTETALQVLTNKVVTDKHQAADQFGNKNTNSGRDNPYDNVLPSTNLDARHRSFSFYGYTFTNGMVFDTRLAWANGLPPPALSADSAAVNMQHMAVMKVFELEKDVAVDAPQAFSVAAASSSQIDLTFTPNTLGDDVLVVWNNDGIFTAPTGTAPAVGSSFAGGTVLYKGNASPQSHTGLNACATYYYKCWSYAGTVYSTTGVAANATTAGPSAPTSVWAGATNGTDFTAAWSAAAGAASYRLDVATSSGFALPTDLVPGYSNRTVGTTSVGVTGLTSGATYYFRVRSVNGACESGNSQTGQVTTIFEKADQTIAFAQIAAQATTNAVGLAATASSGLAVSFAVAAGPATISGGTNLTFTGAGTVSIVASQAGNASWNPAPNVTNVFAVSKATAAVTLGSLAQTFNGAARTATATTAPTGLTVDFTYNGSATAPTNAGSYAVTGTVASAMYQGSAAGTLVVAQASQTISFPAIAAQTTTDLVGLSATASSGLAVSFAVAAGPATISGGTNLTFSGSGTVSIVASQTGDVNRAAAPQVTNTFTVTKATATVTLGSLAQTFNGAARTATATTVPTGLVVAITYDGSATAPTNAGSYAVTGTVNSAIYQGSATGMLVVAKAGQTIAFAQIAAQSTTNAVGLSATASSGLAVCFAVAAGPATISGGTNLTFSGSGTVSIVASQTGDVNRAAAPQVTNTFTVTKATATVMLGGLAQTYDGLARSATATTVPTGLVVAITYDGSATAPTNAGSYAVTGTVNSAIYQGSATGTLVVAKASQTIAFAAIGDKLTTDVVGLSATASSGLAVSFAVGSGPAAITGGTNLSFTGAGTVSIAASQAGNGNWMAAAGEVRTFQVTGAGSVPAIVASAAAVNVRENGEGRFYVKLNSAPVASMAVTIAPVAGGDADLSVKSGGTLTFTPTNWSVWQMATLQAAADADALGGTATFELTSPGSAPVTVVATELDENVGANLALGGTMTGIGGGYPWRANDGIHASSTNYGWTIWNNVPPGTMLLDLKATKSIARIRVLNWDWDYRVHRYVIEASENGTTWTAPVVDASTGIHQGWEETILDVPVAARYLRFTGISNSANRNVLIAELEVYGPAALAPAPVVSAGTVNVRENGEGRFYVKLGEVPQGTKTVTVARVAGGDADLTVKSGGMLTFTPTNWSVWQMVTLQAVADADALPGTATFELTSPGAVPGTVAARELDENVGTNLALVGTMTGTGGGYPWRLNDGIHASSTNYGWSVWTNVPPGTMLLDLKATKTVERIRVLNWDWDYRVHRYTIEASENGTTWTAPVVDASTGIHQGWEEVVLDDPIEARYLRFTGISNSANRNVLIAELEVYAPAALGPAPVASAATVNVRENGEGRFYVKLGEAPKTNKTVKIAPAAGGDADLAVQSGGTLTFTPTNWSVWQMVTLQAAADADALTGTATFQLTSPGLAPGTVAARELDENVGANLALGGTVTGTGGGYPWRLNDGIHASSTNYGWSVWTNVPPGTMTLDLKATKTIARIRVLNWDWDYRVHRYMIEASENGTTWTVPVVDASTGIHQGWEETVLDVPVAARYLRFTGISNSANRNVLIAELEVYGASALASAPVASAAAVNVRENGEGRFYVKLAEAPQGTKTVTVARVAGGDADLAVQGGGTLTFTPTNWSVWQMVTLQAAADADDLGGTATFELTSPGSAAGTVVATELDENVGANLALGGTMTGIGGGYPWRANDGIHASSTNYGWTIWTNVPPGTMLLDLKATKTIARIRVLNWDWDYRVHRYVIEASENGTTWTAPVVDASTGIHQGWEETVLDVPVAARYLRFTGISNSANRNVLIAELEVYGQASAPARMTLPIAQGPEPISVLTSDGPEDLSGWNAVDGDSATAWTGQKPGGGYLVIEYRPALKLSALEVDLAAGSLTNLEYLYSLDAQDWRPLPDDMEKNPVALNFLWLAFPDDGSAAAPSVLEIRPNP